MSYNYSQLNEIIKMQYAKKELEDDESNNNWFFEETIKLTKGYIKPSNYINNITNKIIKDEKKSMIIDPALYIDI
jgi:hypothetical protein